MAPIIQTLYLKQGSAAIKFTVEGQIAAQGAITAWSKTTVVYYN